MAADAETQARVVSAADPAAKPDGPSAEESAAQRAEMLESMQQAQRAERERVAEEARTLAAANKARILEQYQCSGSEGEEGSASEEEPEAVVPWGVWGDPKEVRLSCCYIL